MSQHKVSPAEAHAMRLMTTQQGGAFNLVAVNGIEFPEPLLIEGTAVFPGGDVQISAWFADTMIDITPDPEAILTLEDIE